MSLLLEDSGELLLEYPSKTYLRGSTERQRQEYESDDRESGTALSTLDELIEAKDAERPGQVQSLREGLKTVSMKKLQLSLWDALDRPSRIVAWLLNCELSRRRVPPLFRAALASRPESHDLLMDYLAYDLEWLRAVYPTY